MSSSKVPKVVIDTNVLIAATRNKESFSRKIINMAVNGDILPYATRKVLDENRALLEKAVSWQDELIDRYFTVVQEVVERYDLKVVDIDPEDDKYINAALSAGAEYIITSDKHLLFYDKYENINIVSPKKFYEDMVGESFFDWDEWRFS